MLQSGKACIRSLNPVFTCCTSTFDSEPWAVVPGFEAAAAEAGAARDKAAVLGVVAAAAVRGVEVVAARGVVRETVGRMGWLDC